MERDLVYRTKKSRNSNIIEMSRRSPRTRSRSRGRSLGRGGKQNGDLRLVTYNVLSSSLADPNHFPKCDPEFLDEEYRYEKLLDVLTKELKKGSVICLQEVSQKWYGRLHVFFNRNGYYFICRLYGSFWNDYMGVGIAVPNDKYNIEEVYAQRVADVLKMPRQPRPTSLKKWLDFLYKWTIGLIVSFFLSIMIFFKFTKKEKYPWWEIRRRNNVAVAAKLYSKQSKKSFIIGTYHMPCAFRDPDVMLTHSALVLEHIQTIGRQEEVPYILAGDFNIKPQDTAYQMYIDGGVDNNHPDLPPKKFNWKWIPNIYPVRSAYKDYLGTEPEYTNNAWVKGMSHFVECLDYIWISPEWKVIGADDIAGPGSKNAVLSSGQPFPNKYEPSDHVMLAANLRC
jgi:2',5'-phosphodiesterase